MLAIFVEAMSVHYGTHARLPVQALFQDRRSTLLTTRDETGLVFDVHLQGDRETVFLSYPRHER